MSTRCDSETLFGQCLDLAAHAVQVGCRHEHIKVRNICQRHADDALGDNSHAVCSDCYDLGQDLGHDCPVIARLVTA